MPELELQFRADGLADVVVPAELLEELVRLVKPGALGHTGPRPPLQRVLLRGLLRAHDANRNPMSASGHLAGQSDVQEGPWVSTEEFARMCRVSTRTVRRWADRGLLPGAHRSGRDWIIPASVRPPNHGAA